MPPYLNQPGDRVRALMPGTPEYLYGSWNQDTSITRMLVSSVKLAAGTATLGVAVVGGNIPAVGSLLSVTGTQTDGGVFNVTRAPLTGVTIDAVTGVGTVTFALTDDDGLATLTANDGGSGWSVHDTFTVAGGTGGVGSVATLDGDAVATAAVAAKGYGYADATAAVATAVAPSTGIDLTVNVTVGAAAIPATADAGVAYVDTPEIGETVATGSSVPAYLGSEYFGGPRTLGAIATFPVATGLTVTVMLEWAVRDVDSEYESLGTVTSVADGTITPGTVQYAAAGAGFYRFNCSDVTLGDGTIVAKLLV